MAPAPIRRVAMLSIHGCPLDQLGSREVGGMQVYVRELARELGRAGVHVDVFTRRTDAKLARIVEFGDRARVIHLDAGPTKRIDKNAVVQHLPAFIENIQRFAEREGVAHDVVHSHYWLSGWVGSRLAELWRVPHVATFHTLARLKNRANTDSAWSGTLETDRRNDIERRIIRRADAIVASTEGERTALVDQYGALPERIAVVPPGADLRMFAPVDPAQARADLGLEGENLLFVGRLDPVKGLDTLLEAVALLRDRQSLKLLVVGGSKVGAGVKSLDDDERHLRELAASLGIADRVEWRGPVEQAQLPLYYSAADVTVIPSRYESFGLVALEALACGALVVAASVGGLPIVVKDGENGLLVPSRTAEGFAERIRHALDDRALAVRLRRAGPVSMERFSWQSTGERILSLYRELAECRVAGRELALAGV